MSKIQNLPLSHRSELCKKKRIVIKLGSSILVDDKGALYPARFENIAQSIARLCSQGIQIALVSSGAVAAGLHRLGIHKKPHRIPLKQAIAAAGQHVLMYEYEKAFAQHGVKVAQILLGRDDFSDRQRYLNIRHTFHEIRKLALLPIVNENDTVATEEIKFGDNDNLSALVASAFEADFLIILSDVNGVYDLDPFTHSHAQRLSVIQDIDNEVKLGALDTVRLGRSGGMRTKLEAAEKAQDYGIASIIASGKEEGIIEKILAGEDVGTLILPKAAPGRLNARKHWLAHNLSPSGKLVVDEGAFKALMKGGSLLPSGIIEVQGGFKQGDPLDLYCSGQKYAFARGLSSYSDVEVEKIKGSASGEIENILGYKFMDEVIHRDDLVVFNGKKE